MKEPKIRFKGFSGEWEETKFGNLCSVAMCKGYLNIRPRRKGISLFIKLERSEQLLMLSFHVLYLRSIKRNITILKKAIYSSLQPAQLAEL